MRSKSVLIADDDPMLVRVLTVRCRHLGLEVRQAADVMQALVMIHKDPPGLIIMDVGMPAGDGLSACQMLASDKRLQGIPVIILTGKKNDQIHSRARELGAHYVLKSPDCWQELKPLVCRLLDIDDGMVAQPPSPPKPKSSAPKPAERVRRGPVVLVVDDDRNVTQAIRIRLASTACEVICAHDGAEAFWTAMEQHPDLITLDVGLPELDGISLLQKLKAHPATKTIPVIILTGRKDQDIKRQFLNLGIAAYLTKPFSTRDLLHEIDKSLAERGKKILAE